jgi:hypothetical protein
VHSPAALVWSFPQGRGSLTLTTLRIAPERGPVATVLLEGLLQRTATRGTAAAGDTVLSRIAAAVGR